jgi:hypothetical protein
MSSKSDRKFSTFLFSTVFLGLGFQSPLFAQSYSANSAVDAAQSNAGAAGAGKSSDYFPAIDGAKESVGTANRDLTPVFYSAKQFTIPFSVAATGRQPVEVQLLLSRDAGSQWETYERSRPEARSFSFTAPEDGGYWFSLRTIDDRGMAYPNKNELLYVVIDTAKPDLGLVVDLDPTGLMSAKCSIRETWIDQGSVVLEYQTDNGMKWIAVPVQFNANGVEGEWLGETTWQPEGEARNLMVRLTASDRAGNKSEITRMYSMPRTASLRGMQLASQKQGGDLEGLGWTVDRNAPLQHTPGASPWLPNMNHSQMQEEKQTRPARDRRIPASSSNIVGGKRSDSPGASAVTDPSRMQARWESARSGQLHSLSPSSGGTSSGVESTAGMAGSVSGRELAGSTAAPRTDLVSSEAVKLPADGNSVGMSPGRLATSSQEQEPRLRLGGDADPSETQLIDPQLPKGDSDVPPLPTGAEELPAPEPMDLPNPGGDPVVTKESTGQPNGKSMTRIEKLPTQAIPSVEDESQPDDPHAVPMGPTEQNTYYSRSKSFSLDYAVDLTRGSSVSAIELWGTMDEGKTWTKWGEDDDRESPFDIRVEEEGMFGFRIVIVGSNLVASNQPRAGDPADAWIAVDSRTPEVKIHSAVYGVGEEAGNLVIEYSCSDDQLLDRPISLSFSERRDGPWTTIASGLRNTGRYLWPAEPNLPKRIYLRIEAVDRAANVGVHRLDIPVDVEGLAPRGRIKGFRPLEG